MSCLPAIQILIRSSWYHTIVSEADFKYSAQVEEIDRLERVANTRRQRDREAADKLLAEEKARTEERNAREEERRIKDAALAVQRAEYSRKVIRKAAPWAIGVIVGACIAAGLLIRQQSIEAEALLLA